jgi:hypothetical protein
VSPRWKLVTRRGLLDQTELIKNIQSKLKDRGFYAGPLDGKDSSETLAALTAYQETYVLPSTDGITAKAYGQLSIWDINRKAIGDVPSKRSWVKKPDPNTLSESRLVCDTQEGMHKALDKIVNIMQVVNKDIGQTLPKKERRKLGCEWIRIKKGIDFRFSDLYQTKEGFIFVTFTYVDGGYYNNVRKPGHALMQTFLSESWKIKNIRDNETGIQRQVVTPKNCGVLDQYTKLVD